LAFYSEFFDGLFFGNFVETGEKEVVLKGMDVEGVKIFVRWTYTGYIESSLSAVELWVLGNRFLAPQFSNETMHLLFSNHFDDDIEPFEIDYAYKNTPEKSKLRDYVKDVVLTQGPFVTDLEGISDVEEEVELPATDWFASIRGGGDFM
jgi:hypothetical protein